MSDKTPKERKISFRLNDYLYRFIAQWAEERKVETSEAVRSFCQAVYMDYMRGLIEKKPIMPIDQKRMQFLSMLKTIGAKDMKRVLRNPEVCAMMNGMMENGRNNSRKQVEKAIARPKATNKARMVQVRA